MKKFIKNLLLLCTFSSSLFGANIIFDLGGVLIDTNKIASMSQLGLSNIIAYSSTTRKAPSTIKNKLYEILNKINTKKQNQTKDPDGDALPQLMCDWMTGTQSSEQIQKTVLNAINKHPEWFVNRFEKNVVINLAKLMFTPRNFVKTRKLIKDGVALVKACKAQGHNCYVLSNWDSASFKHMLTQKKYKQFFDLFDGVLVSGNHGCIKPDCSIYLKLIKMFNLNIDECVFIDDQEENIIAAQQLGIKTIHCQTGKPNIKQVKAEIGNWQEEQEIENKNHWLSKKTVGLIAFAVVFSTWITRAI